jgi:hypothetical protein
VRCGSGFDGPDMPAPTLIHGFWTRVRLWLVRTVTPSRGTAALLILATMIALAEPLTAPVSRDEHMYQAAAQAVDSLYRDTAFLQPPLSAWFYAGVRELSRGPEVLLAARWAQAIIVVLLGVVLWRLLGRLGCSPLARAGLLILLLHTEPVRISLGVARNYELALILSLVPWLLLPLTGGRSPAAWRLALAGGVAVLAVACRLTHAAPALLVLAWPLVLGCLDRWRRDLAWLVVGGVVALGLVAVGLRGADPELLRFGLIDYHLANARFHEAAGLGNGLSVVDKLQELDRFWRPTDRVVWSIVVLLSLLIVGVAVRRGRGERWRLSAGLLLCGAAMALIPRPTQASYDEMLLIAGILMAGTAVSVARGRARHALHAVIAVSVLVAVIHLGDRNARILAQAARPATWPARSLHEAGRRLAAVVPGQQAVVLTTHPLYALEADRTLDPVLASGEFVWRLGEHLPPRWSDDPRLLTPLTLATHVVRRRPEAIVVEAAAPWDAPLSDWARRQGWRMHPLAGGVVVWLPLEY